MEDRRTVLRAKTTAPLGRISRCGGPRAVWQLRLRPVPRSQGGVAAARGLLVRSLQRLHIGCERTGAFRASVGSTDASASLPERVGVVGSTDASAEEVRGSMGSDLYRHRLVDVSSYGACRVHIGSWPEVLSGHSQVARASSPCRRIPLAICSCYTREFRPLEWRGLPARVREPHGQDARAT
jgi:hypothetical protein